MMKKMYVISYYFAPLGRADGVNRTLLIKGLADLGWDIDVVTGYRYRSLVLNFQRDESLLATLPGSVKIQRFESDHGWFLYDCKKILGIKNNIRWHWVDEATRGFKPTAPGVIMAIATPHDNALLAYQMSQRCGFPLILYYPDETFDVPEHVVRHATMLIGVTPEITAALKNLYAHPSILLVKQGIGALAPCPETKTPGRPLKMVYAGSFNFRTCPELMLKALIRFARRYPDLADSMTLDMYGPNGYYVWMFLRPYFNKNVRYKGYIAFSDLMRRLPEYDLAITSNRADIAFPSKVYHYLNAGLPVFAITEHRGLAAFVQGQAIGLVRDNQIDAIADGFYTIATSPGALSTWRDRVSAVREEFLFSTQIVKMDGEICRLTACAYTTEAAPQISR